MLSPDQFKFHYEGPNKEHHEHLISAIHPETGAVIGRMKWRPYGGSIANIDVNEEHRRQGVATGMWNTATRLNEENPDIVAPNHSIHRSRAGDAWAKSVGGELPPLDDDRYVED
jgi:hypothetical protein